MSSLPPNPDKRSSEPALTGAEQREFLADCLEKVGREQSQSAYDSLFAFFGPRLRAYIVRLGSSVSEAEEVTQDVMSTLWRKADQFDRSKASVSTWVFRVARNRRIDLHRRRQKPDLDAEEPMLQPTAVPQPDEIVHRTQIDARVREALERLPEQQLVLLQAAFYRGLSHSEIAEAYDLPLGTVKSRIRLAFAKLKGELENNT